MLCSPPSRSPAPSRGPAPPARAALLAIVLGAGCATDTPPHADALPAPVHNPAHVRGADCASCHPAEAAAWTGSHHADAMVAIDVAAHRVRFDGVALTAGQLTVVPEVTPGPAADAAPTLAFTITDATGPHRYPVRYTLAVAPLQQYLVEGDRGRLLVAPVAWDVAAARWFDPAGEGAVGDPADALYWAGITGTWNHMCAECHTTGLDEGFDAATRTYSTRWESLGVTCVACHGATVDRALVTPDDQIDACGGCHSRREPIAAPAASGAALADHVLPALLDEAVYTPLGGIRDGEEPFEIGSFLQSRMYTKGVRCTDCHDPHTGKTRASGNALCESCHVAATYDGPQHHGHGPDTGATECVTCHMPTATYMGIHRRHDHHIRPPDPATSRALGVPDPCSTCHGDDGRLAASTPRDAVSTKFAALVVSARAGEGASVPALHQAVANPGLGAYRRASAAALLRQWPPPPDTTALTVAATDPDPLLRAAAVGTLAAWGAAPDTLAAALADPVRGVRLAALRGLYDRSEPAGPLTAVRTEARATAAHLDSPATWSNLAVLAAGSGDLTRAEADLRTAVALDPGFADARRNLAVLLVQSGRRAEAEALLKEAPAPIPLRGPPPAP